MTQETKVIDQPTIEELIKAKEYGLLSERGIERLCDMLIGKYKGE